jgi:serine/threonine protein kinase
MKLCLMCNFQTAAEEQDLCPRDGSSMVTVGDDPLLGMLIEGRYKVSSIIGQGSAGTVYLAVQELIGREVAIKVLHDHLVSDEEFIKRFTQEAKASSRLSHPNIITIYDFGVLQKGNRPYIAMDLLRGTTLSNLITECHHLSVDEVLPICKQVCGALAEAHRQGVVHRDVKPENIVLVERSGQKLFPIVVDFGIARLLQEDASLGRITRSGTVCGSPTYMSPEQCMSSKVDQRSDIYSLGIVIYEMLTGIVPFESDELVKVMAMHLSQLPVSINAVNPELHFPDRLEAVVARALTKNPDQRYQSMEEFGLALDSVDTLEPVQQKSVPVTTLKDIPVGPLAASDDLKSQREAPPPLPLKSRDLATRALEELASRSDVDYQKISTRSMVNKPSVREGFARSRGHKTQASKSADLLRSFALIGSLALAIVAIFMFAINNPRLFGIEPAKHSEFAEKTDKPNKLAKAGSVLSSNKSQKTSAKYKGQN